MALNGTMVKIETVTVGSGGTTSIDLQNIPQTYTDLVIYASLRQSGVVSNTAALLFNNSSANFTYRRLRGDGSAAASDTTGSALTTYSGQTASTFSNNYIYIPNYTSSNNKSFSIDAVNENNATSSEQWLIAGLWSQTAAISRITINPVSTFTFDQHSTVTLYGISRTTSQIKATGGTVYDDANYVYHLFTSSGTFTPSQNLTCEYLVIAGGGGGALGGGGAGGYRSSVSGESSGGGASAESALSLTANTNYTVTVGAGGSGSTSKGTNGSNSVFSTITSTGGGAGAALQAANSGGSGGGAGDFGRGGRIGTGTANQGYDGGQGATDGATWTSGGGGGGAGSVGQTTTTRAGGNGGAGVSSSITGTSVARGGGGAGETQGGTAGTATAGGGTSNNPGTANTGGGGGGGNGLGVAGGAGGSGVVIVRYSK